MKKTGLIIIFLVVTLSLFSQKITGKWKTIDHETGKAKSYVEIYIKNNKLYGKILSLVGYEDDAVCNCSGNNAGKPIVGMVFIKDFTFNGKYWEKDKGLFDPERDKYYDGRIWLEGKKLKVRGYVGFLYKTQTWERIAE